MENKDYLYFCKWCKRRSPKMSENGYCQKCYEGQLVALVEASALQACEARLESANEKITAQAAQIASLEAEIERLKLYEIAGYEIMHNELESENSALQASEASLKTQVADLELKIKRISAALKIATDALPCDSGVEAGGEQCDYCYAKDRISEALHDRTADIKLNEADYNSFVENINNPPEPNEALKNAVKKHDRKDRV